jgi:hypothetical protein
MFLRRTITVEVSSVTIQQTLTQNATGMSMLKQQANAQQAIVNMIQEVAQSAPTAGRGQHLNITV